ncbi:hypothetical protein D3C75_1037280 [compost metagenome]
MVSGADKFFVEVVAQQFIEHDPTDAVLELVLEQFFDLVISVFRQTPLSPRRVLARLGKLTRRLEVLPPRVEPGTAVEVDPHFPVDFVHGV